MRTQESALVSAEKERGGKTGYSEEIMETNFAMHANACARADPSLSYILPFDMFHETRWSKPFS